MPNISPEKEVENENRHDFSFVGGGKEPEIEQKEEVANELPTDKPGKSMHFSLIDRNYKFAVVPGAE